jgi:hypothetical protein
MDSKSKILEKRKGAFEKFKKSPGNMGFDFVCATAGLFGFEKKGGKGSHTVFTRKGVFHILNFQNVKGKVKPYQIKQFLKIIEENNLTEEL